MTDDDCVTLIAFLHLNDPGRGLVSAAASLNPDQDVVPQCLQLRYTWSQAAACLCDSTSRW